MSEKSAYQAKLEAQLEEWRADMEKMQARAKQLNAEARVEYERQLAALQRRQEDAAERLRAMRRANEEAWEDMRKGAEKAWDDMAAAMRDAMSRYR